jgi:hypothetical protein
MSDIHSCSYYCDRPACIKAQRDELRDRFQIWQAALQSGEPVVDVDAQDAERYRFIRARIGYDNNGLYLPCGNTKPDPSLTDSAIDKALLSAGKENNNE